MTTKKLKKLSTGLKPPKNTLPKVAGCTFTPATKPSRKQLLESKGQNDHSKIVQATLDFMIQSHSSFSLNTLFQLLASREGIEKTEIAELWEIWSAEMERTGRIRKSPLFENSFVNLSV